MPRIKICTRCGAEYSNYYSHGKVCTGKKPESIAPAPEPAPVSESTPPPAESTPTPVSPAESKPNPTESLADIEKQLNADVKPIPASPGATVPTDPATTQAMTSAANIIYIRYAFKFVNSFLNKTFKCNDWDMTDDELKKLEDAVIATLNYYKVQITPPVVLIIVLTCAYILPLLKHLGILDKIKAQWQKNKKDLTAEPTPEPKKE